MVRAGRNDHQTDDHIICELRAILISTGLQAAIGACFTPHDARMRCQLQNAPNNGQLPARKELLAWTQVDVGLVSETLDVCMLN